MGWPPPADLANPAAFQDYATLPPVQPVHSIPGRVPIPTPSSHSVAPCPPPSGVSPAWEESSPGRPSWCRAAAPWSFGHPALEPQALARHVIVIGDPANRAGRVPALGATATIPLEGTTVEDRRGLVSELTEGRGADAVIECTGRMEAFDEGMNLLADDGRYVVLGIYSGHGTVQLDPYRLNNRNLAVIGSLGPRPSPTTARRCSWRNATGSACGAADSSPIASGYAVGRGDRRGRRGEAIKAVVVPSLGPLTRPCTASGVRTLWDASTSS